MEFFTLLTIMAIFAKNRLVCMMCSCRAVSQDDVVDSVFVSDKKMTANHFYAKGSRSPGHQFIGCA